MPTLREPLEPDFVNITYTPLNEGDPIRTEWNGLLFHANKPLPVPSGASYLVPMAIESVDKKTGIITKTVTEMRMSMVERAKLNPYFKVDGFDQARRPGKVQSQFDLPKTSIAYRSWVLGWLAEMTDATELDERWEAEEQLRERCLYDAADESFLIPFVDARRAFLRGASMIEAKLPPGKIE